MPLLKKARIEVYLPRSNKTIYKRLRAGIEKEFLSTFDGFTLIENIKGSYVNENGGVDLDVIDLLYVDTPLDSEEYRAAVDQYAEMLQKVILEATDEEAVLVAIHETLHAA